MLFFFHLNKFKDIQETELLVLGFENLTNHGVESLELRWMDSGLITRRPLTSFDQYYGDLIVVDSKSSKFSEYHYTIVMEQNRFLEEDTNCINYPSEQFQDYQSCDEAFQREYLQSNVPCKPYWAYGHVDEEPCVCYNETVWDAVSLLYVGATISSCSLPCTTTVANPV